MHGDELACMHACKVVSTARMPHMHARRTQDLHWHKHTHTHTHTHTGTHTYTDMNALQHVRASKAPCTCNAKGGHIMVRMKIEHLDLDTHTHT